VRRRIVPYRARRLVYADLIDAIDRSWRWHRGRRRLGSLAGAAGVGRLASRPVLERRADGEGARQAVGLLVRDGAWRRWRLGEAAMAVVGARRTSVAVVAEGDEWTGRGTVRAGQPSLSHRADDTAPFESSIGRCPWADNAHSQSVFAIVLSTDVCYECVD
jgi:hypothetical protein